VKLLRNGSRNRWHLPCYWLPHLNGWVPPRWRSQSAVLSMVWKKCRHFPHSHLAYPMLPASHLAVLGRFSRFSTRRTPFCPPAPYLLPMYSPNTPKNHLRTCNPLCHSMLYSHPLISEVVSVHMSQRTQVMWSAKGKPRVSGAKGCFSVLRMLALLGPSRSGGAASRFVVRVGHGHGGV
jgi:hypothetical protein